MIRKIDDEVKKRLRIEAARNGRSMEEEARRILTAAVTPRAPLAGNAGDVIASIVDPIGGIELDLPHRGPVREPPRFDDWPEEE
jgi:plasmid stability protein